MKLYIMRHGEAEELASSDAQRPLTEDGITESQQAGVFLRRCEGEIGHILVSPYLRAQQTLQQLGLVSEQIDENGDLIPEGDAVAVHQAIDDVLAIHPQTDSILLVSHMPLVCLLIQQLTKQPGPLFATATVLTLEYNPQTHTATVESEFHP